MILATPLRGMGAPGRWARDGGRAITRSPWTPQLLATATSSAPLAPDHAASIAAPDSRHAGTHPLAEQALGSLLQSRADRIRAAFDAIEPLLQQFAQSQFTAGFQGMAQATLFERLGLDVPADLLATRWTAALDMRRLHARCVMATFLRLVDQDFARKLALVRDEPPLTELVQRWGFHAIDIAVCADGRLSGVLDYILRIPSSVVAHRRSHAGAMFDVEDSLRHWEAIELRRWRSGWPNSAIESTRFLKLGVYHFSSVDPGHAGCAAHGSDTQQAAASLLVRLEQFAAVVHHQHGTRPAILMVGVDTDTDAIRVHVPDAHGEMTVARFVDNAVLYDATHALPRDDAKEAIRLAVAACAGVPGDDAASTGMRWLCGYLLKNNLGQYGVVRTMEGGRYADTGHTERLIVVGDAIDAVQLRNLAFQAQMDTVEEGGRDLDIGIEILRSLHEAEGLAVPVLVHCAYRMDLPGARERASSRAARLQRAVAERHANLVAQGVVQLHAVTLPVLESGFCAGETLSAPRDAQALHSGTHDAVSGFPTGASAHEVQR